jgi:hypothetical protein
MVLGVAGYGNLGAASLAALPSSASPPSRRQSTAEKQKKQKRASIIEVDTSRADDVGEEEKRPSRTKRVRGETQSEQPAEAGVKPRRRRRADCSPPAEPAKSGRASRKRQPESNFRAPEQDSDNDAAISGNSAQAKPGRGPPLSLASLAASAAAVAVSGAGVSMDNMRCVTVKIGGVEVQVPMIARGARPPSRPIKSASELEADMHSLVLGWDIAQAAESEDSDRCGVGHNSGGALKQVPVRFGSADEYEDAIAPLLMHECLQQVRLQPFFIPKAEAQEINPALSCSLSRRSVSIYRIAPTLALFVA